VAIQKLSDFIRANAEPILERWEQFAKHFPSARHLNRTTLRDHARGILQAVADDLDRPETSLERKEKSKSHGPSSDVDTEAEKHGISRMSVGFSLKETMAEFRYMRASVLHLWTKSNPTAMQSCSKDITRFNEAIDQALTESIDRFSLDNEQHTRLFDTVLSSSPDFTAIFDVEGRIIYANRTMTNWYKKPLSEMVGKNLFDLGISNAPEYQKQLQQAVDGKTLYREEISYTAPSGENLIFEFSLIPVVNAEGAVDAVAVTGSDITERKKKEETLNRSANYDVLTGLPNRGLFLDQLKREVKRSARNRLRMALFFLDLDDFKDVNDRLGHAAGDELLQQVSRRISACVRDMDTVARLGGDEFMVIITEIKKQASVDILAREILNELAKPFSILGEKVQISGSIGITLFPQDATVPDDLIKNADQAMYSAKEEGKNRYRYFTESMQQAAENRMRLIDDLRVALKKKQLRVYYQPIVELATGRIVKAEALVRWQHPVRGFINPAEFVPLAEETGMIVEIGDWVFRQAAQQVKRVRELHDPHFQVSLNKSPVQFRKESTLYTTWIDYLRELNLSGDSIVIEITERLLTDAGPLIDEKLNAFHTAGIQLSLDDFGTGSSSIANLKKFHIDILKIDKCFCQDATLDSDEVTLSKAIIVMAHMLGIKVTAEGVETVEQKDWLKSAGCDNAQGFVISKPVSSRAFEKLLNMGKAQRQGKVMAAQETDDYPDQSGEFSAHVFNSQEPSSAKLDVPVHRRRKVRPSGKQA
jgi:diguanylate cyclase (GGDEF)-like protein/PAS domain S-box-containing protein